ncbi:hypothetical protein [Roseivivax sp. CAU 1761]
MVTPTTQSWVPRTNEGDFLGIDIDDDGQVMVDQTYTTDTWGDRERRLMSKLTIPGEVNWVVHHANPSLNVATFVFQTPLESVPSVTQGCLLNECDVANPEGPAWQRMRNALQERLDRAVQ